MFLISPLKVRDLGLTYIGIDACQQSTMSHNFKSEVFQWHYGSPPMVVANIWYDLQQSDHPVAGLKPEENTLRGFKFFMLGNFYLWTYPKNAGLMASRFQMCERYCRGEPLHKWIRKIAGLYQKKIKWIKPTTKWTCSVDCTDMKIAEKRRHYHLNIDKRLFSKKTASAALKYEIVLSVTESKCMSIVGPFPASRPDMALFRDYTKGKMLETPGGMGIMDAIYKPGANQPDEIDLMAIPNSVDPEDLKVFKSRVRCRHETFNGRIKNFSFLRCPYRGTNFEQHGECFRAICIIVQYQMDNGAPLFSVH